MSTRSTWEHAIEQGRIPSDPVPEHSAETHWTSLEKNAWKEAIKNQRHFNGLIIQSRTITNSVYAAITALAVGLAVLPYGLLIGGTIMLALAGFMFAMRKIDAYYWELLIAAVEYADRLEQVSGLPTVEHVPPTDLPSKPARSENPNLRKVFHASGLTDYIHQRVEEHWAKRSVESYDTALLLIAIAVAVVLFSAAGYLYLIK